MAPPRKHVVAPPAGREVKLRLPEDVAARIEQKAKSEGRPMNRVIVNELASVPYLERAAALDALVKNMSVVLARYGARITAHDLSDELLGAVDAVLNAEGGALQAAADKLRVVRTGMLAHQAAERRRKP